MKIWILIWRLNPPHIWHMRILEDSLKNTGKTILFLWSANVLDDKNPYSYQERKGIIEEIFSKEDLFIESLDDLSCDKQWVKLINKKLTELWILKDDEIIFYGWDFENDYAILIIKKYIELLDFNIVNFKEIPRKNFFVEHNSEQINISSTLVREAINNNDKQLLKRLVSREIYNILFSN